MINYKLYAIALIVAIIVILCIAVTFGILFVLYTISKIRNVDGGLEDENLTQYLRRKYRKLKARRTGIPEENAEAVNENTVDFKEDSTSDVFDENVSVEFSERETFPDESALDSERASGLEVLYGASEKDTVEKDAAGTSVSLAQTGESFSVSEGSSACLSEGGKSVSAPIGNAEENAERSAIDLAEGEAVPFRGEGLGKEGVAKPQLGSLTQEEKEALCDYLRKKRARDRMFRVISNILLIILMIAVVVVSAFAISFRARGGQFFMGGDAYLIISTDSMSYKSESNPYKDFLPDNQIEPLSLIGIEKIEEGDLQLYDIVAYTYDNVTYVHRIVAIKEVNGRTFYTAMGDANNGSFAFEIDMTYERMIGRYNGYSNYGLGVAIFYLQSNLGIISCAFALLFLLCVDICEGKIDRSTNRRIDYLVGYFDGENPYSPDGTPPEREAQPTEAENTEESEFGVSPERAEGAEADNFEDFEEEDFEDDNFEDFEEDFGEETEESEEKNKDSEDESEESEDGE